MKNIYHRDYIKLVINILKSQKFIDQESKHLLAKIYEQK